MADIQVTKKPQIIVELDNILMGPIGPSGPAGPTGPIGPTGPSGVSLANLDGGAPDSNYGGISAINCGGP